MGNIRDTERRGEERITTVRAEAEEMGGLRGRRPTTPKIIRRANIPAFEYLNTGVPEFPWPSVYVERLCCPPPLSAARKQNT